MSNVPAGAVELLDFIGVTETGRKGIDAYRTIYGHKQGTLPKPVTDFTLDELLAAQLRWGKNWGSSAAGKYQIIRATLKGLVAELGLPGSTKFTPTIQDQMGFALLKRRGWSRFIAGQMSLKDFGNSLAKEWASFPVLTDIQGASRHLTRGQSYYAGDGLNKALVKPGDVEAVLSDILNRASVQKPAPQPIPAPSRPTTPPKNETPATAKPRGKAGWVVLAILAIGGLLTAGWNWLVSLFT